MDFIKNKEIFFLNCFKFIKQQDDYHNLTHLSRVISFAKEINKFENANEDLVIFGAFVHQFHDPNLHKLKILLKDSEVEFSYAKALFEIAEYCRPNKICDSNLIEAKIVFDADALDLLGPSGFLREYSCNIKYRNCSIEEAANKALEIQNLFESKLQTKEAKNIANKMSKITIDFFNEFKNNENFISKLMNENKNETINIS